MIIMPAIDIINGKCVRLVKGEYDKMTVYSENPIEIAESFKKAGARYLHVIDLDGAKTGVPRNIDLVRKICDLGLTVETGGGIRNMLMLDTVAQTKAGGMIIGTSALSSPLSDESGVFLQKAVEKYKERIIVGIDVHGEYVATNGWIKTSGIKYTDFIERIKKIGVKTVIFTDISRDGTLTGPNFDMLGEVLDKSAGSIKVIASGGISRIDDIIKLKKMDLYGAIIGKALYTGSISLSEALKLSSGVV